MFYLLGRVKKNASSLCLGGAIILSKVMLQIAVFNLFPQYTQGERWLVIISVLLFQDWLN